MPSSKQKLSEQQLRDLLIELPEWALEDGKLVRDWTLPTFVEAIAFVNRVAQHCRRGPAPPRHRHPLQPRQTGAGLARRRRHHRARRPDGAPAQRRLPHLCRLNRPVATPWPRLRDTLVSQSGVRSQVSAGTGKFAAPGRYKLRHWPPGTDNRPFVPPFLGKPPPIVPVKLFFAPLTKILHPIYNQR